VSVKNVWEPPSILSRTEVVELDHEVAARRTFPARIYEDIFHIQALEMEWDIGVVIYEPQNLASIPKGPDDKKIGVFLLHGGVSDYKSVDRVARTLAEKFGIKVASMTFPGRFYLLDPSRDWPGDIESPDGTARTPLWTREMQITKDQYEIVQDTSKRESYGTLISLSAKQGTEFYGRMAAWPVAFEEAMKETARRHLPEGEYSIYIHGHSTGGPFAMIAAQHIPNISGVLGYGTSPFGYMYTQVTGDKWEFPFNRLRLRTWRDTARYLYEGMKDKGIGLPMLMELTLERWETGKRRPNFKAEDFVHKNSTPSLVAAARASAARLKMSHRETDRTGSEISRLHTGAFRLGRKAGAALFICPWDQRRHCHFSALSFISFIICETKPGTQSSLHFHRCGSTHMVSHGTRTTARRRPCGSQALVRCHHERVLHDIKILGEDTWQTRII